MLKRLSRALNPNSVTLEVGTATTRTAAASQVKARPNVSLTRNYWNAGGADSRMPRVSG